MDKYEKIYTRIYFMGLFIIAKNVQNWRLAECVMVHPYNIELGNLKIYRFLCIDIGEKD